jgi:hypothetical protein
MVLAIGGPLIIGVVVVALALMAWAIFKNRSTADEALTDQVRRFTQHDVNALTEQIRRVGNPPEAADDLTYARQCEDRAVATLRDATKPEDIRGATAAIAEGYYAVACAHAHADGLEPPEQRRVCYFDPAHGLSVMDVEWAPVGEDPVTVPACAACAAAVNHRADPTPRMVTIAGMSMPHWRAPENFDPWAAGFFGSERVAA